jgi:hypothetical protein
MNREKTIRFLRQICLQYEVKVVFRSKFDRELDGEADTEKEIIYIDKKLPRRAMSEAVFHELGHIYCVRKGIWKKFHKEHDYSAIKSFKAENWIEHWAKREWDAWGMRKFFGQYRFAYLKSEKQKLIKWFEKKFKLPRIYL